MKKISLALILGMTFSVFFIACKKEEANSTPAPKQEMITSFTVNFYDPVDTMVNIGNYTDPDGPGPKLPELSGISLKKNRTYEVSIMIEDAQDPNKVINIDSRIKSNGKDYKICMDNSLNINFTPTDSDGSLPIGLLSNLSTSATTGNDMLTFTIKYQKGVKDGQCSPGTVYYNCVIPVTVY
jgi:hypothetical protein